MPSTKTSIKMTIVPEQHRLHFCTLPPEIRRQVYHHLFDDLAIHVEWKPIKETELSLAFYQHRISSTCRLLRAETIPILRDPSPTSQLRLVCHSAYFPNHVRRRLPDHVYRSIRVITISRDVRFDQLQPTRRTFPNLCVLEFDLSADDPDMLPHFDHPTLTEGQRQDLMSHHLRWQLRLMHDQACMPREGLERDYFPDDTLWDVVNLKRNSRGFDVNAWVRCHRYDLCSIGISDHGARAEKTFFLNIQQCL